MFTCKLLFNNRKINFTLSALLYFISLAVTPVAFCYNDQNIKSNLYTEFKYEPIKNKDVSLFSKIGLENFITDKIKLKIEYGKLLDINTTDHIIEDKKKLLSLAIANYNSSYFTQTDIDLLYCDQQSKLKAKAKLGTEFNIVANIYIQPKIYFNVEGVSEQVAGSPNKSQIHSYRLLTGSEMSIGASFYITNTNIRLNPEIAANYNTDIIDKTSYSSNISANIACDINSLICKLSYSYSNICNETLAIKFGLKI